MALPMVCQTGFVWGLPRPICLNGAGLVLIRRVTPDRPSSNHTPAWWQKDVIASQSG